MQGQLTLDPAAVERFRADWYGLTRSACADRALLAASGGPDSTALLLLFAGLKGSTNPPVVGTVDHGLREHSSAEAGGVADLCRRLGLEHTVLSGPLPPRVDRTANLSARARALRYALLEKFAEETGARWIVTGHHADDQLETMVMRLNRASGVGGLAGIRPVTGKIVRPLLDWRRDELQAIVAAAGVTPVADPSNADDRFDRARLRKQLAGVDWLDPRAVARSAHACADADEALDWAVDRVADDHCWLDEDEGTIDPIGLPAEIRRRLVQRCLRHIDPAIVLRGDEVTRLLLTLGQGGDATLGQAHATSLGFWTFRKAPPRRTG